MSFFLPAKNVIFFFSKKSFTSTHYASFNFRMSPQITCERRLARVTVATPQPQDLPVLGDLKDCSHSGMIQTFGLSPSQDLLHRSFRGNTSNSLLFARIRGFFQTPPQGRNCLWSETRGNHCPVFPREAWDTRTACLFQDCRNTIILHCLLVRPKNHLVVLRLMNCQNRQASRFLHPSHPVLTMREGLWIFKHERISVRIF